MGKVRVLFVCAGPGVRARVAEAFLRQIDDIDVASAQFEEIEGAVPSFISSLMAEIRVDIKTELPKSVFARHLDKEAFDFVISLCHASSKLVCPVFRTNVDVLYSKKARRLSWSIPDFRSLSTVPPDQRLDKAWAIIDNINLEVLKFARMLKSKQAKVRV